MTHVNVKERVETLTNEMTEEQQTAIRALGDDLDHLNQAMAACVESGLAIELRRTARHHSDDGYWGDLIVPMVVKRKRPIATFEDLDPSLKVQCNMARARDIRSAYVSMLLLWMWNCAARWLRKRVLRRAVPAPSREDSSTGWQWRPPAGHLHRA